MTINLRKKNSRARGTWTHGHGEKKKHRGAGSRGGRGNAGSGKRGDAKKPSYWKIKNREGKHGFVNYNAKISVAATISQLNVNIKYLLEQDSAKKENNMYVVDLTAFGVNKLIGTGNPEFAFKITVNKASELAIKKIVDKGGEVIIKEDSEIVNSKESTKKVDVELKEE